MGRSVTTLYQISQLSICMCAGHVLIGDNEGLYLLDITGDNLFKFGDRDVRKVSQIRVLQEDNLVALLAGEEKQRLLCYDGVYLSLSLRFQTTLPQAIPYHCPPQWGDEKCCH